MTNGNSRDKRDKLCNGSSSVTLKGTGMAITPQNSQTMIRDGRIGGCMSGIMARARKTRLRCMLVVAIDSRGMATIGMDIRGIVAMGTDSMISIPMSQKLRPMIPLKVRVVLTTAVVTMAIIALMAIAVTIVIKGRHFFSFDPLARYTPGKQRLAWLCRYSR